MLVHISNLWIIDCSLRYAKNLHNTSLLYFISLFVFLTIGHMGLNAHRAQSQYILYSTNRGMRNLKPSSVHVMYWSFQFSLVSFCSVTIDQ